MHPPIEEGAEHVVEGTVVKSDIISAADDIKETLREGTSLLLELSDYEGITTRAMARDVAEAVRLAPRFVRCRRIAVVAGKDWIRMGSRLDGAVIPNVDIRAFEPGELDAARAWLDERVSSS